MISPNQIEKIKEITREFFNKTSFGVEVEVLPQSGLTIPINLETDNPQVLIGEGGQTLTDFQHILKAILRREIQEDFYIDLDINGYKEQKKRYLRELAGSLADEVSLMKKDKILPPMPAYERRIIHIELADRTDVTTESIGREPERRIIIKPYP